MLLICILVMTASMVIYGFYLKHFYFKKPVAPKPATSHSAPQ